ncbi:MAG: hypothetical protein KA010_01805 [Saprospiraceae bacterium]|nr:hypothetical protein [Saprospiraceae bacterium]
MRNGSHNLSQQVGLFLDKGLSAEDQRDFLKEVKHNPSCSEMLQKEQTIRAYIKNGVSRKKVSPDLIQSIKDKIKILPTT